MRVALFYHNLVISGGGPRQVLSLARELSRGGHEATVYAFRHDPSRCYPALSEEVDVRAVVVGPRPDGKKTTAWMSEIPIRLRQFEVETRQVARLVEEPFDVLNPHERPAQRAAVFVKRRYRTPIVWMFNDPARWESGYYFNSPLSRLAQKVITPVMRAWEKSFVRRIDAVTVLDHRVQGIFCRMYGSCPRVVRTGFEKDFLLQATDTAGLRAKLQIPPSSALILFAGILLRHRRVEDLLAALKILREAKRNVKLVIVGSPVYVPDYFDFLTSETQRFGIEDDVVFVPENVSEAELRAYYKACDIFVFPNEEQTWGLAPLEAMVCGKPVIVSTGAGVHEILQHRESAILVPPRRPELIAEAVGSLLDDPCLRQRLADQGKALVMDKLSWSHYAKAMVEVFEEAMSAKSSLK